MHPIVILIAGFLVVFVGGGARFAIGLTLKPMVDELGWTRGELGLAVGVYFVVSAVCDVHCRPHRRSHLGARCC